METLDAYDIVERVLNAPSKEVINIIKSLYKIVKVIDLFLSLDEFIICINDKYLDIYKITYKEYDVWNNTGCKIYRENLYNIIYKQRYYHGVNVVSSEIVSIIDLEEADYSLFDDDDIKNNNDIDGYLFALQFLYNKLFIAYSIHKIIKINAYYIADLIKIEKNNRLSLFSYKHNDKFFLEGINENKKTALESCFIYELKNKITYNIRLTDEIIKVIKEQKKEGSYCSAIAIITLSNSFNISKSMLLKLLYYIIGNKKNKILRLPVELINYIYDDYFYEDNIFI